MWFRRKEEYVNPDKTTQRLLKRRVYSLSTAKDHEYEKFDFRPTYSFWWAAFYTFTLSILLWWFPIVGPMIAGYVGGRKAGWGWKGALAAALPMIIIFFLTLGLSYNYLPSQVGSITNIPSTLAGAISHAAPSIQPYVEYLGSYFTSFVNGLQSVLSFQPNVYLITIIFAYIGGLVATQHRMELQLATRSGSETSIHIYPESSDNFDDSINSNRYSTENLYPSVTNAYSPKKKAYPKSSRFKGKVYYPKSLDTDSRYSKTYTENHRLKHLNDYHNDIEQDFAEYNRFDRLTRLSGQTTPNTLQPKHIKNSEVLDTPKIKEKTHQPLVRKVVVHKKPTNFNRALIDRALKNYMKEQDNNSETESENDDEEEIGSSINSRDWEVL